MQLHWCSQRNLCWRVGLGGSGLKAFIKPVKSCIEELLASFNAKALKNIAWAHYSPGRCPRTTINALNYTALWTKQIYHFHEYCHRFLIGTKGNTRVCPRQFWWQIVALKSRDCDLIHETTMKDKPWAKIWSKCASVRCLLVGANCILSALSRKALGVLILNTCLINEANVWIVHHKLPTI